MLVIKRRLHEKIVVTCGSTQFTIMVVQATHGVTRLAFDAPPNVTIHRHEVQRRLESEESSCREEETP